MTNNNEDGTPIFQVTSKETRLVTIEMTHTVLGGTPESVVAEIEAAVARSWDALNKKGFVTVGPVVEENEVERLREIIQNVYNNLKYDTGNIDVLDMLREGLE